MRSLLKDVHDEETQEDSSEQLLTKATEGAGQPRAEGASDARASLGARFRMDRGDRERTRDCGATALAI